MCAFDQAGSVRVGGRRENGPDLEDGPAVVEQPMMTDSRHPGKG